MQKRRVGRTDIFVSPIGLGTVKFGRNTGVKYPHAFDLPSDKDIQNLLDQAKDLGINLLDTAPAYGNSEARLGFAIKNRHDWIICTKVGEQFAHDESTFDFSPRAIQMSIEHSLRTLNTPYLDIVLVHSNGDDQRIIEEDSVFDTLTNLKQTGKIRAFGMSTKTIMGGMLTVDRADVAMVTYNIEETQDKDVIEYAYQQEKGIFIKKGLVSGHVKEIKEAMHFIFKEPGVTSLIVGTINPIHLKENMLDAIAAIQSSPCREKENFLSSSFHSCRKEALHETDTTPSE